MMTATKTVNYTPEMVADIVEAYKAGETVESIASRMEKSPRSIVAKLSREGVYVAKTKAKAEGAGIRKADLITEIAHSIGTNEELLESLEKATKEALELIARAVKA
jgi:ppGpp synthetase/RelA/SpoT-type nucleotidyltranferase